MMNLWNLAELASKAAIGIDSHIIGQPRDERFYVYVKELAQEIECASRASYLNPTETIFLADSIWPYEKNRGNNIDQIYLEANILSKDLYHFEELSRERQEELRGACLSLSKAAQRYSRPFIFRLVA